jgi:hypothetical protein
MTVEINRMTIREYADDLTRRFILLCHQEVVAAVSTAPRSAGEGSVDRLDPASKRPISSRPQECVRSQSEMC